MNLISQFNTLSIQDRAIFLQNLPNHLTKTEEFTLSSNLHSLDYIARLPIEISQEILKFLPDITLITLRNCSKPLRKIVDESDEVEWRCKFWNPNVKLFNVKGMNTWIDLLKYSLGTIEKNWWSRNFPDRLSQRCHTSRILSMQTLPPNKNAIPSKNGYIPRTFVTLGKDRRIRIWLLKSDDTSLDGHSSGLHLEWKNEIHLDFVPVYMRIRSWNDRHLALVSSDSSLDVIDIGNTKFMSKLQYADDVKCLAIHPLEPWLFCFYKNSKKIVQWNIKTGKQIKIMDRPKESSSNLWLLIKFDSLYIVSGNHAWIYSLFEHDLKLIKIQELNIPEKLDKDPWIISPNVDVEPTIFVKLERGLRIISSNDIVKNSYPHRYSSPFGWDQSEESERNLTMLPSKALIYDGEAILMRCLETLQKDNMPWFEMDGCDLEFDEDGISCFNAWIDGMALGFKNGLIQIFSFHGKRKSRRKDPFTDLMRW